MTTLCICCGKPARDKHHPWPKSQNGKDRGTVTVCRDDHSLYHAICNPQLAATVKARVANFGQWMSKFPQSDMMGHLPGINPADMAPDFVQEESGHFILHRKHKDLSEGCLSTLGKVKVFKERTHFGNAKE